MRIKMRGGIVYPDFLKGLEKEGVTIVEEGAYEALFIANPLLADEQDMIEAFEKGIPIIYRAEIGIDIFRQRELSAYAEVIAYASQEARDGLYKALGDGIIIKDTDVDKLNCLLVLLNGGVHETE